MGKSLDPRFRGDDGNKEKMLRGLRVRGDDGNKEKMLRGPRFRGDDGRNQTLRHPVTSRLAVLALCGALAACGFKLRGEAPIAFKTVFVESPANVGAAVDLKRLLGANKTTSVAADAKGADAVVHVLAEARDKQILSLSAQGRVREFQLRYRVSYKVMDREGREIAPPADIALTRVLTFDDRQLLAKTEEENLLFRDMQADAVQQILRRLAVLKPS